mmetsp:Transcript_66438/g.185382  ORF Transcript_66438/g.185382 Transcript_66438/m.185382 type:complete len:273 (-) Transcript_66438:288-1106(-)
MAVDVVDRGVGRGHGAHRHGVGQELLVEVGLHHGLRAGARQVQQSRRVSLEPHAVHALQGAGEPGQELRGDLLVNQERLHGIARCAILGLGVHTDLDGLVQVCVLVDVHGADAIGVAEDRDPRAVLDRPDELVRAARDHQVDVLVALQQLGHLRARVHALDAALGQARLLQGRRHRGDQRGVRPLRLAPPLQQQGVPRLHGERRYLHRRVRARLEDDEEHPDRAGDPVEVQAFRHAVGVRDLPHGVGQLDDLVDARQEGVELGAGDVQALQE